MLIGGTHFMLLFLFCIKNDNFFSHKIFDLILVWVHAKSVVSMHACVHKNSFRKCVWPLDKLNKVNVLWENVIVKIKAIATVPAACMIVCVVISGDISFTFNAHVIWHINGIFGHWLKTNEKSLWLRLLPSKLVIVCWRYFPWAMLR